MIAPPLRRAKYSRNPTPGTVSVFLVGCTRDLTASVLLPIPRNSDAHRAYFMLARPGQDRSVSEFVCHLGGTQLKATTLSITQTRKQPAGKQQHVVSAVSPAAPRAGASWPSSLGVGDPSPKPASRPGTLQGRQATGQTPRGEWIPPDRKPWVNGGTIGYRVYRASTRPTRTPTPRSVSPSIPIRSLNLNQRQWKSNGRMPTQAGSQGRAKGPSMPPPPPPHPTPNPPHPPPPPKRGGAGGGVATSFPGG